jgi:diguanylate cyclase (GGDEF)-like protein
MIKPDKPQNEAARLAALQRYEILDTPSEQAYDDLMTILAGICDAPIGAVSLIDAERQWFKARVGLDISETSRDISFCAHALLDPGELLMVEDAMADLRFHDNPLVTGNPNIRFYAGAPLLNGDGQALGTLCVMDRQPRQLTPFQQTALRSLSRQVSVLMELRRVSGELRQHMQERDWYEQQLGEYQAALESQNAQLAAQTRADPLTGLANRRALNAALDAGLDHARAIDMPLALAICDIDHFKRINDEHGHPAGDRVLIALAQLLQGMLDEPALASRCGGEEFALLMPGSSRENAAVQCESIRARVAALALSTPVTISLGLTTYRPGDNAETLYARADQALYEAKRGGRNRLVVAE